MPSGEPTERETLMREIRIHGRGGQGAVIASKLLASALFYEGRHVQAFPSFGVERRGAPVTAFVRYADEPVLLRCEILSPDELVVLDPTLLEAIDVTAGLKEGGSILVNAGTPPRACAAWRDRFRVAIVDASAIARRLGLGSRTQPIVNTAILGAYARFSGAVGLESAEEAIRLEMADRAAPNLAAAREAAESLRWISGAPERAAATRATEPSP
jgi:2-oxoacid:acceptor oxidoreductase gamma subunit (pyruvate/2-ketoisovalerate family)